jgi:heat shock protein HslJ
MNYLKIFLLILAVVLAGCSSQKTQTQTQSTMNLNDIWALVKIQDKELTTEQKKPQPMVELHLKEGKFLGNTGCNEMSGKLEYSDTFIKFSEISQTKMFCAESVETEFLIALKSVDSWKIEKLTLYLKKGNDVVLTFKKVD